MIRKIVNLILKTKSLLQMLEDVAMDTKVRAQPEHSHNHQLHSINCS